MFTMLIDHLGIKFFSDENGWRVIGRIALPLYAALLVLGMTRTSDRRKYLIRLIVIGSISAIPHYLFFQEFTVNIIFVFAFALIVIQLTELWPKGILFKFYIVGFHLLIVLISPFLEYGLYGYILVLIFYYFTNKPSILIASHVILNISSSFYYYGVPFTTQMFSIVGTFIFLVSNWLPTFNVNRNFYRAFYPTHLLILWVISIN